MASEFKFGSFGRYQEIAVDQMSPEMKDGYAFTMHLRRQGTGTA